MFIRGGLRYGTGSGSDRAPSNAPSLRAPGRYRSRYRTTGAALSRTRNRKPIYIERIILPRSRWSSSACGIAALSRFTESEAPPPNKRSFWRIGELNSFIDDARARLQCCVDLQIGFGTNRRCVFEPEEGRELVVRPHGDKIDARRNPITNHCYFCRGGHGEGVCCN